MADSRPIHPNRSHGVAFKPGSELRRLRDLNWRVSLAIAAGDKETVADLYSQGRTRSASQTKIKPNIKDAIYFSLVVLPAASFLSGDAGINTEKLVTDLRHELFDDGTFSIEAAKLRLSNPNVQRRIAEILIPGMVWLERDLEELKVFCSQLSEVKGFNSYFDGELVGPTPATQLERALTSRRYGATSSPLRQQACGPQSPSHPSDRNLTATH